MIQIVSEVSTTASVTAGAVDRTLDTKIDAAQRQGFRVITARTWCDFDDKTAGSTVGPVMLGVAINMTEADIQAYVDADPQDAVEFSGKANGQYCQLLGLIGMGDMEGQALKREGVLWKPNWSKPEGNVMGWFLWNIGAGTVSGWNVHFINEYNGVFLRD